MVAFIPILASIFAIVGIGQVFKPRLPQYSFQINQLPILKYINGSFKTKLGAGVKLQNDNYVPIDVHSLSFDLYYPNHWSKKKNSSLSSNLKKTKSESELDKYEITNHHVVHTFLAGAAFLADCFDGVLAIVANVWKKGKWKIR